jgi:pyridoxine kinase
LTSILGYIGSVTFLQRIVQLVHKLRKINNELIFVCDPVMGDNGKMYVPDELADVFRKQIVKLATIMTPNQYEAELLTGMKIISEEDAIKACDVLHGKGVATVVITSIENINVPDSLSVIASTTNEGGKKRYKVRVTKLKGEFTGTGDLFSALLPAYMQLQK